jgi:hypothetical protein
MSASSAKPGWLTVDLAGLAKLMAARGPAFVVFELLQNAWDENVTKVDVVLESLPERGRARLVVTDDAPDGFRDLADSYTLFAESGKKADPTKRGRFNLGEKTVLALCDQATIISTTGGFAFERDASGHPVRRHLKRRRDRGTEFAATIRLTRVEVAEVSDQVRKLLGRPSPGRSEVITTYNGVELLVRTPLCTFEATLPTEIADDDGILRRSLRQTQVSVYEPRFDEIATIYEMGIPVIETGDRYSVDVGQKVPLNFERDNVRPAYLRDLRVLTLNAMHAQITADEAVETWVRDATEDEACSPAAITRTLDLRFGEKRVAFDPSDKEANAIAHAQGYTVVPGGALSGAQWKNAKAARAILPAGQVTASSKVVFDPNGPPMDIVPIDDMPKRMREIVAFTWDMGLALLGIDIKVTVARLPWSYSNGASYGDRHLIYNLSRLGQRWFADGVTDSVVELVLHELAHEIEADHLSRKFYDAIGSLGTKLARLALDDPERLALWRKVQ